MELSSGAAVELGVENFYSVVSCFSFQSEGGDGFLSLKPEFSCIKWEHFQRPTLPEANGLSVL